MNSTPPRPKGDPLFGNARQYADDPFRFLTACERAYGDVVQLNLGPLDTYMVTNPDDIQQVLVADDANYVKPDFQDDAIGDLLGEGLLLSEGETWQSQRKLANPAFMMDRLEGFTDTIAGHAETMVDSWADGDRRNVELAMTAVTLDVICDLMLDVRLSERQRRIIRENLEPIGARFEPDPIRFITPDWVPTPDNREYQAALSELEGVVDEIIAERRGTEGHEDDDDPPMDVLSILLRAQNRGEQSETQLRDEVVTMLLAGHDTTALTLTYSWYLLANHPEIERQVHEEVDAICDGSVTMADVREMDLIDRVIKESNRLYPPVYVIFRQPTTDVELGGYRVPEGSSVMLPQWAVHRSPDYWESPEQFDPGRWTGEDDRPRFAYFPFGGGPRHCIGKHLALLEAKVIMGTIAQQYSLDTERSGQLELRPSLTIHPRGGLEMTVEER
ncbi:cytochrome P450 [Halapricum sp. CBA1109]|uniref:cytochrome P450 n=1 Tax=Halapricum sp. CBA1109 TaxID=2668068 RepID=UPI0012F7A57D|nr:cytochrome P450 [Halapricum sp. CBA1109]MUV91065.1 cytochrome P450 [Halapricum sp. CBA1109]